MAEGSGILLVEDNPDDEALTIRALRRKGIANEITVARDGAEALELLHEGRSAGRPPDLVILDLKLPKIEGIDVLRRIRANPGTRSLPVVVLTSSDEQQDIVRSYELGANSFVSKPVEFESFLEAVGELGLYWLLLNRSPGQA